MKEKPSAQTVPQFFDYVKETGEIYHKGTLKIATIISRRSHSTYRQVYFAGALYPATHIAWAFVSGEWPKAFIDHIDRNGENNKWENLRCAERWQNQANQKLNKKNKSGYKGVNRVNGKWRARIQVKTRRLSLGYFDTKEEAHTVYWEAAQKWFGEFARKE